MSRLLCRDHLPRFSAVVVAIVVIALNSECVFGQLPQPQLNSISPLGGKRGTTVEITVAGTDLDEAYQLLFSNSKIKAEQKFEDANEFAKSPKPVPGVFKVSIGSDVPVGLQEVRVVGRFGMSNPRIFFVSSVEELAETAGNSSPEKAMELPIGPVINGRVDANSRDYYKLSLQQGQRILIECISKRLDSRMDAALILYGPDGREISRARDPDFSDALIDFTAPASGSYIVAVHDFVYGGGADYFYRLSAHTRPRIDFVLPPSGLAGSNGNYTFYGRNLPKGQNVDGIRIGGATLQKLTLPVSIPADATISNVANSLSFPRTVFSNTYPYHLGDSEPVAIAIAKAPVVSEIEPNNSPSSAQKVSLPIEYVGQFFPAGDTDWIQFEAKKGDAFVLEVISHRQGLSSDPAITIQKVKKNDKGEETASDVANVDDPADRATRITQDFDTSTDDPSYRLSIAEDGIYRILIRDQFGTARHDPRITYRLVIRPASPDFGLVVTGNIASGGQNQNQQGTLLGTPVLRKGGAALFQLNVERLDDFKGEIEVSVEGLPSGVTCPGIVVAAEATTAPLIFTATENAEPWSGTVRIVGKAKIDGKDTVRVARAGTVVWGSANRQTALPEFRVSKEFAIAVAGTQTAPASVAPAEDRVFETSVGANLEIPLSIARRGDFKEALKLAATGLPTEIKPGEVNVDANSTTGKLVVPLNAANVKPNFYTFYLKSDAKFKFVRNPDAMKIAEDDQKFAADLVAMFEQKVKDATAAKEQATKAKETADALEKVEKSLKEAQAKLATAKQKKQEADKRAADAKTAMQPKDTTMSVISAPIRVLVKSSPFTLKSNESKAKVKQNDKTELSVAADRHFGFADAIDLTSEAPKGIAITSTKSTIAKDQKDAKLELKADKSVAPGEYTITIRGKSKFNNVNVETTEQITLQVEAN